MPKIGILTYHNNENRGAILQAYCLQKALSDVFSVDVEIVEYRTRAKERTRRNQIILSKRPWKVSSRLKDRRLVESFLSSEMPISSESLVTDEQDKAVNWIEEQNYDLLVTGSDEVWKIHTGNNASLFSPFFPDRPFPSLYFLDPRLSAMKAAYAASANTVNLNSLEGYQRDKLKEHLSAYEHISVRDRHTEELLNTLGIDSVNRVPDPTLLVNIPMGNATTILQRNGINLDKPILGFHGQNDPTFKDICDHYRNEGYQIVTSTASPYADLELEGKVDPFEYYDMYNHYDMVVTSSLHSTIFSLKNGTPFVTIDVNDDYTSIESKTYSLLNDFSLIDRYIDAVNDNGSMFYDRIDELEHPLDEEHVTNRIEELRKQGLDFLQGIKEDYEKNN